MTTETSAREQLYRELCECPVFVAWDPRRIERDYGGKRPTEHADYCPTRIAEHHVPTIETSAMSRVWWEVGIVRRVVRHLFHLFREEGIDVTEDILELIYQTGELRAEREINDPFELDHAWLHGNTIDTSKGTKTLYEVLQDPVLVNEALQNTEQALAH